MKHVKDESSRSEQVVVNKDCVTTSCPALPPAQSYGFRDFSPTKIISSAVIILEEEVRTLA